MNKKLLAGAFLFSGAVASAAGPPTLDLVGVWTAVGPRGAALVDFSSKSGGVGATRRDASSLAVGSAVKVGDRLQVSLDPPSKGSGFVGALKSSSNGSANATLSVYRYDPVEDCYRGFHGGVPESLRRSSEGNAVDVYVETEAFAPYVGAIRSARETISLETYEWHEDAIGNAICSALEERARAGVRVRAMMDGLASRKATKIRERLKNAGAEVTQYLPVGFSSIGSTLKSLWVSLGELGEIFKNKSALRDVGSDGVDQGLDNRDHRKVLVVDGRVAFVGGMNLGDDYMTGTWHDVHARLRGPAVARVQRHFLESWEIATKKKVTDQALFPALGRAGDLKVDIATTLPGVRDELHRLYVGKIRGAKREVLIQTPYFGADEVVDAACAQARRGVHVQVILPDDEINDVKLMGWHHGYLRPRLAMAGVEVRTFEKKFTHAKVAVIDGAWSTVGSCNLDNRSMTRDLEENISVDDPRFAALMKAKVFDPDAAATTRYDPGAKSVGFIKKALGFLANFVRDVL